MDINKPSLGRQAAHEDVLFIQHRPPSLCINHTLIRASERNISTILLVLWPVYCVAPASTYPQICTDECALYTNQITARSGGFIYFRDPNILKMYVIDDIIELLKNEGML
jgi:hypothetical protein